MFGKMIVGKIATLRKKTREESSFLKSKWPNRPIKTKLSSPRILTHGQISLRPYGHKSSHGEFDSHKQQFGKDTIRFQPSSHAFMLNRFRVWASTEPRYISHLISLCRFMTTCFVLELVGSLQLRENETNKSHTARPCQVRSCEVIPIEEDSSWSWSVRFSGARKRACPFRSKRSVSANENVLASFLFGI